MLLAESLQLTFESRNISRSSFAQSALGVTVLCFSALEALARRLGRPSNDRSCTSTMDVVSGFSDVLGGLCDLCRMLSPSMKPRGLLRSKTWKDA